MLLAAVAAATPATASPGLAGASATAVTGRERPRPRAPARPPARWVRVSVATLWVRPGEARRVDAPACAVPADPRAWVAGMTTAQKRWLVGRLETQALYGAKVYLLGTSGSWSKVAVAGQPTPRNRWGYPGWLPTRQLTASSRRRRTTSPSSVADGVALRDAGADRARARGLVRHGLPGRRRRRERLGSSGAATVLSASRTTRTTGIVLLALGHAS